MDSFISPHQKDIPTLTGVLEFCLPTTAKMVSQFYVSDEISSHARYKIICSKRTYIVKPKRSLLKF